MYHDDIATLHHEVLHHSVEGASLITSWFIEALELACAHLTEILSRLGHHISEQLHLNTALPHPANRQIKEHNWICVGLLHVKN